MGKAKAAEAPLPTGRLLTYADVSPILKGRQAEVSLLVSCKQKGLGGSVCTTYDPFVSQADHSSSPLCVMIAVACLCMLTGAWPALKDQDVSGSIMLVCPAHICQMHACPSLTSCMP